MTAFTRLAKALRKRVAFYGELTDLDVKRAIQSAGVVVTEPPLPKNQRCARCRRRLSAKSYILSDEPYGEKCYKIMKEQGLG